MRRADREITDTEEILAILQECNVCHLGMALGNSPYIVPLNYGYTCQDGRISIIFHSAKEGRKIDMLAANPRVCFQVDCGHSLVTGDRACSYGYAYRSVIGFGTVAVVEEEAEKAACLNILMKHQTGEDREFSFDDSTLRETAVFRLPLEEITGKQRVSIT